jgi:hypothetical protein
MPPVYFGLLMTTEQRGVKTIYVDLDHTLICIDLLRDFLLSSLLRRPWMLLPVLYWFFRGGPRRVKAELSARYSVDPTQLPYNAAVVDYLRARRCAGDRLVLATAAAQPWAEAVAAHVKLFDKVLATSIEAGNLKGRRKLEAMQRDANGEPFGYAGDAEADRPIFEAIALPIVVGATAELAGKNKDIAIVLPRRMPETSYRGRWKKIVPAPPSSLGPLLVWTMSATLLIFFVLELWRPCYFLTDDNLSIGLPLITEMGRHIKEGQSPFISDYLFGGHYNELRDMTCQIWHPFMVGLSLLADTSGRFWIIDICALLNLLIMVTGFTVLACWLRREFSLAISDGYLIFFTLSFVFSNYTLIVGPSWINFLCTQSCLPWLTLGILTKSPARGMFLVFLFTVHDILAGYAGLVVSAGLCLSVFAFVVARSRGSFIPLFSWAAGNVLALLVLAPLLLINLDGFGHSIRIQGMSVDDLTIFNIPPGQFLNSLFVGNWSDLLARWHGITDFDRPILPVSSVLACAAAWCVWVALFNPGRWNDMDRLCAGIALALVLLIVRPLWLAVIMQHLPVFRSLRWPFREGLIFLFFIHLFLILRWRAGSWRWQNAAAVFGFLMFTLPMPFMQPPSFNALKADRQLLFSGRVEAFWTNIKPMLQPGDEIATVIDIPFWDEYRGQVPYSLLGTADYPALFKVRSISGYSPTTPVDQMPVAIRPYFWFGAYSEDQVGKLVAWNPKLKLIRITSVQPFQVTMSTGAGPAVDLTPYLPK